MQAFRAKQFLIPILIFLVGAGMATLIHWPALTNYAIYHSDVRQAPHWAGYHRTSFQPDDLLLQYGAFNESPIQNLIYYLGTFFIDVVTLSKVLAVLSYGLATLLFFVIGKSLFGSQGGFLAAVFFAFFPDQFDWFVGFFSKAWALPLLLVAMFILKKERWSSLLVLLPFSALAYPTLALLISAMAAVYLILTVPLDRQKARVLLRYLVIGSSLAMLILLLKYLTPPAQIKLMTSGKELLQMPEMYLGGLNRSPYLPVSPVYRELLSHLNHPFVLFSAIIYFLVLRKKIVWDKSWTALLIASVICYLLADYFFMRLYIPNRYSRYSLAVLLVLWNAGNCDLILKRISQKGKRLAVLLLILAVAGYFYRGNFKPRKNTDNRKYVSLYQFIAQLPEQILVAGHPYYMSGIPIQAKRSVLCNYKMAHPWFQHYYTEIRERTLATFKALYATDPADIDQLYHKYGVTYLVVGRSHYREDKLRRGDIYVKPYDDYIQNLIRGKDNFLLQSPPMDLIVYDGPRYRVIKLPLKE